MSGPMRRERRIVGLGLALALATYLGLALPIVDRQGIHWDEQTDLEVAAAYTTAPRGFFHGSRIDVINTRLPMATVAFLDVLGLELGLRNARLVSCAVGALAILLIGWFGSIALDPRKGLVAAWILATSPYFLAFSPLAFSEGDVFVACAVGAALVTGERFRRWPSWGRGWALGTALGLAVSAKISGAAIVAAVVVAVLLPHAWRDRGADRFGARRAAPWLAAGLAFGAWLALQAIATGAFLPGWRGALPPILLTPRARFALVTGLLGVLGAVAWWRRAAPIPPALRPLYPPLLAAVTFFVVPPVHTTNPAIFPALWREMFSAGGGWKGAFALEAAELHLAVVLIKPGLLIGAALALAAARSFAQLGRRPELRLPAAIAVLYAAFLLALPWAQVRYMLPVFLPLALFGADALVDLARRRRGAAVVVGLIALANLGWDYRLCYPDLALNGYQWVGTRYWGGRSTLGYRGIAQVGDDGVEQVLRWSLANVEPGSRVASYLLARHTTRAVLGSPPFELIDGLADRHALERADYVLSSLGAEIRDGSGADDPEGEVYQYPLYDRARLERDFEKVFAVRRAFGIEVASVWRRR